MTFLMLIPAVLSLLVLGAHFYRAGWLPAVAICLAAIALLLVPRRWAMRIVQLLLVVGALEWMRTMYLFVGERAADGRPWTRLAIILGAVAAITALSAIMFESRRLTNRYR